MRIRHRLLAIASVAAMLPATTAAPAFAGVRCPMGEHRTDPCVPSYWTGQLEPRIEQAQARADETVAMLQQMQALIEATGDEAAGSLAPLSAYVDAQLAAAQTYVDGFAADTTALAEELAANTAALVTQLEQAAADAACPPS